MSQRRSTIFASQWVRYWSYLDFFQRGAALQQNWSYLQQVNSTICQECLGASVAENALTQKRAFYIGRKNAVIATQFSPRAFLNNATFYTPEGTFHTQFWYVHK